MTENTNDIRIDKSLFCIYTSLELEKKQILDFLKTYFNKKVFIKEQTFFGVFSTLDKCMIPYKDLKLSFLEKILIFNDIKLELRDNPIIVLDIDTVNDDVEVVMRKLKIVIPFFVFNSKISDYDNIINFVKNCYVGCDYFLLKLNSDFEYVVDNNDYISFEQFIEAIKEGRIEII